MVTTARKTVAKKEAVKSAAKKKAPAKKVAVVKKTTAAKKAAVTKTTVIAALKPVKEPFNKTGLIRHITETTELAKKDVVAVLESLGEVIKGHIHPKAIGKFTLPGLLTIKVNHKPAVKARKGINPLTGLETMFKAKPARRVVKIKPLKKLKDVADNK